MGEGRRSPLNLNSLLAAVEAAPPVAAVDVLAAALAEAIDAREVSFLIADFSGRSLIRLGHSGGEGALRLQGKETAERVPLVGTPHGRALAGQAVEVVVEDRGARLFAPVTSRGEAVGVLELGLEDFPSEQTVADVALAAHFLAYVVIANRRFTDLFEWGQRSVPLSLAAEIQHRLLPDSYTCEASQFTPRRLAGTCRQRRRRHLRLLARARHGPPLADGRHGPRRRGGRARDLGHGRAPQPPPRR